MSKTPIIDKIKKYLSVMEKVTLSKTLDTGIDTSNFTKNWTQAGLDAEKFLGLDKFGQKYGGNANVLNVTPDYYKDAATTGVVRNINNALFGNVRKKQVDLLQVAQTQSIVPESVSVPYIWRNSLFETLNEAQAISLGANQADFYKIGKSGLIFTRQAKFPGFFYAAADTFKIEQLLYNGNGAAPRPGLGPVRQLQEYATNNFAEIISRAVDNVKQFTSDEESLHLLDQLKTISIDKLPMVIHDSLMLGFVDAANLNIHKTNESVTDSVEGRVGWQVLAPTSTVLNSLENAVMALKKDDEVYLTDELAASLSQTLEQTKSISAPFDTEFKQAIKNTLTHKKFNIMHLTQSSATGIYFVLSQIINQINKIFVSVVPREVEARFFFGNIGYNTERSAEQFRLFTKEAAISTSAPMAIIRAITNFGGNADNVFLIDPYVMSMDIKKIKASSEKSLDLGSQKPVGLTSVIHNHIIHAAQGADGTTTKEAYIKYFLEQVKDKSANLPTARFGKDYWKQILSTCLKEDLSFADGVLWVGIPPIFWDKADGDKTIYIYDGNSNIFSDIEYNYIDPYGNPLPEKYKLLKNNIAAIFYDRVIDRNTGKSVIPIPAEKETIQLRQKELLSKYKFKSLAEIREEILQNFYSRPDISQRDLAQEYRTKILKIFKNTEGGFWSIGGSEIAGYNPWEYGGETGSQATTFRFISDNTNDNAQRVGRKLAKEKYLTDTSALEEGRNNYGG